MPDITNDVKPSADWLAFFTDLPVNLARMATLRDELEKRQGAMSAVEAAAADREQAAKELADAKAKAAAMLDGADAKIKEIAASQNDLAAKQKAFEDAEAAAAKTAAARDLALDAKAARLADAERVLQENQSTLEAAQAKLASDTAILEARIKAFQEKVAHLTA